MQRAANPFRATFFSFWVVRKLATVNSEPSKSYQTGVTWGRPSGRTVARAATCGWLREALTSAGVGTGMGTWACAGGPGAPPDSVHVLTADGVVGPVMERYLDRGLDAAEDEDAAAVVIRLDTPGGAETSM